MTKEAFETIKDGLFDALAVSKRDAEQFDQPAPISWKMTPSGYRRMKLIHEMTQKLRLCRMVLRELAPSHPSLQLEALCDQCAATLAKARKELE
jgi:hypothetical protein